MLLTWQMAVKLVKMPEKVPC